MKTWLISIRNSATVDRTHLLAILQENSSTENDAVQQAPSAACPVAVSAHAAPNQRSEPVLSWRWPVWRRVSQILIPNWLSSGEGDRQRTPAAGEEGRARAVPLGTGSAGYAAAAGAARRGQLTARRRADLCHGAAAALSDRPGALRGERRHPSPPVWRAGRRPVPEATRTPQCDPSQRPRASQRRCSRSRGDLLSCWQIYEWIRVIWTYVISVDLWKGNDRLGSMIPLDPNIHVPRPHL